MLGKLAGIVASLIVFVVFGELATRWLDVIDRLNGTPRDLYAHSDVADLPYVLTANNRVELEHAIVTTDEHGLRSADGEAAPTRNGGERILVLGDSVTFGNKRAWPETFPAQLERILAERHGRRAEVLNAGVPGYNTAAEAAFLHATGAALAPDRVVLQVSVNDFGDAPGLNPFGVLTRRRSDQPPSWLERHSELYVVGVWTWKLLRGQHWFQGGKLQEPDADMTAKLDAFVERTHRAFYDAPRDPQWRQVRESLAALRTATGAAGVPLTVVLFPERYQFAHPAYRAPQQAWLALCEDLGIAAIDLWPVFDAALQRGAALFDDVQHPNAAGLELAASAVAAALAGDAS